MPALYVSEITDPELLALPQYAIGDRVRVAKITLTKNDAPDTKQAFLSALGRVLTIKEIELWETNDPENPYFVTYEFHLGNRAEGDIIYLTADEVEPIKKRSRKKSVSTNEINE